jgi:thioredoxin reductase
VIGGRLSFALARRRLAMHPLPATCIALQSNSSRCEKNSADASVAFRSAKGRPFAERKATFRLGRAESAKRKRVLADISFPLADHRSMSLTSHYDVIIIGGGPAGLSAALMLGLARRRVLVIDSGKPRNAAAPISHGFLTRDGVPPGDITAAAREQLRAYPHVEIADDTVTDAAPSGWLLSVSTASGQIHRGRKLILANGMADKLPPVPGLAECWGKSIFPCPYCHAWDYRDQPLALLGDGAGIFRVIAILRSWSKDVVLLTNGPPKIDANERMLLHQNKVNLYDQPIAAFEHEGGQLTRVAFQNGTVLSRKAILFHPPTIPTSDLPTRLGLINAGVFKINPQTAQTTNPNVFVAGDIVTMFGPNILTAAVHSGAFTARHVNEDLAVEDFTASVQ